MIGPYDLSASLGIPGKFNSTIFKNCLKIIEQKTKKSKKILGIHVVEPNKKLVNNFANKKYNFIVYSLDTVLIKDSIKKIL